MLHQGSISTTPPQDSIIYVPFVFAAAVALLFPAENMSSLKVSS